MNFDQAFDKLIGHEGGYSNHAADPGGATMYGITVAVARANGYKGDMEMLTLEQAKAIYHAQYWLAIKADQLPDEVRFDVFDAAVNSGPAQAAKWLQRAVGAIADGVIGLQTLAACKCVPGAVLTKQFNGVRLQFLTELPGWPAFGRGWARRVAKNLMAG